MQCRRCDQIREQPGRDTRHRAPHVGLGRIYRSVLVARQATSQIPRKPSCSVLVALWGPSADRTWAIPGSARTTAPGKTQKPATARSAPRWRRADRQRGGELWSPIGGSPFSATNCQARKRTAQAASRTVSATCTSGSNSITTPIRAISAPADRPHFRALKSRYERL